MLSLVDRIIVPFQGSASEVEELTWGQREIYTAMVTQESWLPIVAIRALSQAMTIEDVVAELKFCLHRYDSMRTRLVFTPDAEPRQAVAGTGEVTIEVFEAGATDPADLAAQVAARYRDLPYDFTNDWPVRSGLVLVDGQPSQLVGVYCHLVMDAFARAMLLRDLAARPATTQALTPTDLARWERGGDALASSAASMRQWERLLQSIPSRRFPRSQDPRQPRYWEAAFESRAMHLALRVLSPRAAQSTAPLLALFAIALHRITGTDPVVAQVVVSNRFRAHLADVFAPVNQTGLFAIEVAGQTGADVLRASRGRAMSAYKNAYYDPRQRKELLDRVCRERGEDVDIACFFNDRRMDSAIDANDVVPSEMDIRQALGGTSFEWRTRTDQPSERLFVHVEDVPEVVHLTAWTDTHHLAPATLEAVLREMEAVAVAMALDPRGP